MQSFADYKVQAVKSFPDLKVEVVESFQNSAGKWQIVDSFPDYKIEMVESFPDFTIEFVKSFPGQAKRSMDTSGILPGSFGLRVAPGRTITDPGDAFHGTLPSKETK